MLGQSFLSKSEVNLSFWKILLENIQEFRQNTQTLVGIFISVYPCFHPCEPPKNSNYCKCWSDRVESRESTREDKGDEREREIVAVTAGAKSCSLSQPYPQLTLTQHNSTYKNIHTIYTVCVSPATYCCSNHFAKLNNINQICIQIIQIFSRHCSGLFLISTRRPFPSFLVFFLAITPFYYTPSYFHPSF